MTPDFNLLITLDALLEEGSVAGAARRLGLSASAMSRALARLRDTTGDPLLVRAGRGLIPTPRAQILRDEVARLVQETRAVLRPQQEVDPASLERWLSVDASGAFALSSLSAFVDAWSRAGELGFAEVVVHWPRPAGAYAGSEAVLEDVAGCLAAGDATSADPHP